MEEMANRWNIKENDPTGGHLCPEKWPALSTPVRRKLNEQAKMESPKLPKFPKLLNNSENSRSVIVYENNNNKENVTLCQNIQDKAESNVWVKPLDIL